MKKLLKISSLLMLSLSLMLLLNGCDTKTSTNDVDDVAAVSDLADDEEDYAMVTEDAYGEDLSDVVRYPDSLRSYYVKDEYETDITYETTASESEVREYYKSLLAEQGWELVGDATDYIDFEKGDEDNPEMLTVYLTPYEDEGYLEYELVYSPPLTEEELAEMDDEEDDDVIEIE